MLEANRAAPALLFGAVLASTSVASAAATEDWVVCRGRDGSALTLDLSRSDFLRPHGELNGRFTTGAGTTGRLYSTVVTVLEDHSMGGRVAYHLQAGDGALGETLLEEFAAGGTTPVRSGWPGDVVLSLHRDTLERVEVRYLPWNSGSEEVTSLDFRCDDHAGPVAIEAVADLIVSP
jgi:hypothetical protein